MNHAACRAARAFPAAWPRWRLVLLAASLAVPMPATAQYEPSHVPGDDPVDEDVGRAPFDARPMIRDHLRSVLPPRWRASDPVPSFGAYTVTVYLPGEWQGNATSAMMRLCPPSGSAIWRDVRRIEFVPVLAGTRRAIAVCGW